MKADDYTSMGGTAVEFLTTHWSFIEEECSQDQDRSRALIGCLLERYWKPVYCYLRRKGYDNEQAKDLTQGFFHEVVLQRGLVDKADQSKGRFRSFLLAALKRYLINAHNERTAQKRIPKDRLVSLDTIGPLELPQTVAQSAPEDSFNYAWVSSMLEDVLDDVQTKCHEDGKTVHWQLFHDRVLRPILDRTRPPSLKDICDKYKIRDGVKASNMIVTVKRRFQTALRKRIRESLLSDELVDGELEELRRFFPKVAHENRNGY